jgi:hypothetical protein
MARMASVTARLAVAGLGTVVAASCVASATDPPQGSRRRDDGGLIERVLDGRSLDGFGNNLADPTQGQAGMPYPRIAPANYADGIGTPVRGPAPRYVSNRIFNDVAQNVFSERGVSQWGFVWGQFLDHTFGLRLEGDQEAPIVFDAKDPLEEFDNDLGSIQFTRSARRGSTWGSRALLTSNTTGCRRARVRDRPTRNRYRCGYFIARTRSQFSHAQLSASAVASLPRWLPYAATSARRRRGSMSWTKRSNIASGDG